MNFIGPTKVFAHLDRLAAWQHGETPAPVTVEWDLSNRCYLGCEACHFAHTHTRGPWALVSKALPMAWQGTGDLAPMSLVQRGLAQMAATGVQGVVFSGGGEPTTHPSWLTAVETAVSHGLHVGMYTAGGLLKHLTGARLGDLATWVVVSLDAMDRDSYNREKRVSGPLFENAVAGIRSLVGRQATVGVSFLLHEGNWQQAPQMVGFGLGLGATYVTFRPRIDTSADNPAVITSSRHWITEAVPMLDAVARDPAVECDPSRFIEYRDWKNHGYATCHGIKLNTTVTPDGRVWVCLQRRGMQGSCLGDLATESFAEIWARHPGVWTDFAECRAMCRLHLINKTLDTVFTPRAHAAFV